MRTSPEHVTTIASWLHPICHVLGRRGLDAKLALSRAGIAPEVLHTPRARVPVANMRRLWAEAVTMTGNDAFGIEVATKAPFASVHALGFAIQSSSSLRDVMQRLARFYQVVSNAVEVSFTPGPEGRLALRALDERIQPPREGLDACMALIVCRTRALMGDQVAPPLRVRLDRPRPVHAQAFDDAFRCPIEFNAGENALYFAAEVLDRPLPGADPELALHNDRIVAEYLATLNHGTLTQRVYACLIQRLPSGPPDQAAVADTLGLSLRTLQRRLQAENSSFQQILDTVRFELAKAYLWKEEYSLGEVGYLLGFSDHSNFNRAFKRWAGMTPAAYRQQART